MATVDFPATPLFFGMIDHSGEATGTRLHVEGLLGDGSNMAELSDNVAGAAQVLKDAIALITDCNLTRTTAAILVDESAPTLPSTVTAQREIAFRFTYQDTITGSLYTFTIPGPAVSLYPVVGTDELDMGSVAMLAFALAFDASAVSPDNNAALLISGRLVGRNS